LKPQDFLNLDGIQESQFLVVRDAGRKAKNLEEILRQLAVEIAKF